MTSSNQNANNSAPIEGVILNYPRTIAYRRLPDVEVPKTPAIDVRARGFLGLGANRQDQAHARRLRELFHLAREAAYAEHAAGAIEVKGIQTTTEAVAQAESIVYSTPADTVAGMLAADLTSEMTARSRLRHGRLMDVFDAEAINVIHRR